MDTSTIILIQCERRQASMTERSCVESWTAAQKQRPEPWDSRWHCRNCTLGAARAGHPDPKGTVGAEELHLICPRCQRQAQRLINGLHCVSCYNRNREAQLGRNGKGAAPKLTRRLHAETLAVVGDTAVRVERASSVVSVVEAMILAAKKARGRIAFGRVARYGHQFDLFA